MDITQALKDTENSLRDFVGNALRKKLGDDWAEKCGVTPDRIDIWKHRRTAEAKRQESGVVEERLIYYADFYDIKTILRKNWGTVPEISTALGDLKTVEVWLSELENLRDPDAHRRELLPHQKHLAIGIAGEIRTRLIRYRSKQETSEDYFPRIESARDSLGNIWTPDRGNRVVKTGMCLRVGDKLDFVLTATDPLGEVLLYSIVTPNRDRMWQDENVFSWDVVTDQVGKEIAASLYICSNRYYRAHEYYDDTVAFLYDVLPARS